MKNPALIETVGPENYWSFNIPTYKVDDNGIQDGEGMVLNLCRGNKEDANVPRQEGVFTETLLEVALAYLQHVNKGELASRDTSIAITHIEDALLRIRKRAQDRAIRGVQGTYQK